MGGVVAAKKIGFNGRPFCQEGIRGLGRHTLELIKWIHQLRPEVELYVYCFEPVSEFYRKELPFVIFRDTRRRPKILWDLFWLRQDVLTDGLDIFHSTNNLGVPLLIGSGPRILTTIHDSFTHDARRQRPHSLRSFWDYFCYQIEYSLLSKSDLFFTVSENARLEITSRLRLPPERVRVSYNGASLPEVGEARVSDYFLYVGGLEKRKNVETLLRAIIIFNEKREQKIPLRIVGNLASATREVQILLESRPELFELRSGVNDRDLAQMYQSARAFIFPSKQEGFGLPLVEAMSLGTPVIASDIPVFREIAQWNCLYFLPESVEDLAQKLELLQSEDLRQDLVRNAKQRATVFTWERMAQTVLHGYDELIKDSKETRV